MMGAQPNAAQKRWRESVRDLGMGQVIHHAIGRTIKKKGVGNLGHWFLVPLANDEMHWAVHNDMGKDRKPYEKARFARVCERYQDIHGELPLPPGVYDAIMEYTI